MWTWIAVVASGVIVATLGWYLQQILARGTRWRALALAGHELDVAAKLDKSSPHRVALQERAAARLDMYLRDTSEHAVSDRNIHKLIASAAIASLTLMAPSLAIGTGFPQWVNVAMWTLVGTSTFIAITEITLLLLTRPPRPASTSPRPVDGTPPAPPEQPTPTAHPTTPDDPEPPAPPPPAEPRPAPPT